MWNLSDFVDGLTDVERQKIIKVLEKDLELQRQEQERIRQIQSRLNFIRQRSALRASTRHHSVLSSRRKCARCKEKLGYVVNSGATCPRCKQLTCESCRRTVNVAKKDQKETWLCVLCYTTREYSAASGEWFYRRTSQTPPCSSRNDPTITVTTDEEPISDSISVSLTILGELQKAVRRSWRPIDTRGSPPRSPTEVSPVIFRHKTQFKRSDPKRKSSTRRKKTAPPMGASPESSETLQQIRKSSHMPEMGLLSVPGTEDRGRQTQQSSAAGVPRSPSVPAELRDRNNRKESKSPRSSFLHPLSAVRAISTGNLLDRVRKHSTRSSHDFGEDDLGSSKDTDISTEVDSGSFTNSSGRHSYGGLTKSELESKTLCASVWHSDKLGHNTFLGEVDILLSEYPWSGQPGKSHWYTLGRRHEEPPPDPSHPANYCGELHLSIKFVPPDVTRGERSTGSLHCLVRSVKNLASSRPGTIMNHVIIKAYLYPDKRKHSKQKSPGAKGLTDVIWNHTFVYPEHTVEELKEHCLELTVWDHQRLGTNEFLGGVRLNLGRGNCRGKLVDWMDGTPLEMSTWREVMEKPNSWVEGTIPLRSTMAPR